MTGLSNKLLNANRSQLQGKHVFVVEDNLIVGQFMVDTLFQMGATPVLCRNGAQAWQKVQNVVFPILILDWNLPEMNGGELCRKIRTLDNYSNSIILIITGKDQVGRLEEAFESGADDYITKPVTADMLRIRLEIMLIQLLEKSRRIEAEKKIGIANSILEEKVAARTYELRKSQSAYQSIIANLDIGVVLVDKLFRILQINPKMCEWVGCNSDLIGRNCHSVIFDCDTLCQEYLVKKSFKDGKSHTHNIEFNKNNLLLNFRVLSCPVCDEEGNTINVVLMIEDITEQVKNERELKVQLEEAKKRAASGRRESLCDLVGSSGVMNNVYAKIESLRKSRRTVLLQGETGTGKEVSALALHKLSPWSENAFISVNCGSLPESILESELFGHTKGAFTGALSDKAGLFAAAESGTIFLDEIEAASMHTQVALLRVLDQREVYPIGGRAPVKIHARIVVASNKDLEEMVAMGKFREDLYYRICEDVVYLPALRDRIEDLPSLANHFLEATGNKRIKPTLSPKTLELLSLYGWPGNVREFRNLMNRLSRDVIKPLIRPADLPEQYKDITEVKLPTLGDQEKELVVKALQMTQNNKSDSAKILGISRNTVYSLMKKHNIS